MSIAWQDSQANRNWASSSHRFLAVRHASDAHFYRVLLTWLEEHHPAIRSYFELRQFPCRLLRWQRYRLHIPWLQDPVQNWSPDVYRQAVSFGRQCDAHGVAVINRVERLANAGKSAGAERIARVGIRTPRMAPITDAERFRETLYGFSPPVLVREDWGHGARVALVESLAAAKDVALDLFTRPIAVEFIDVRSGDGLYRKYRYVAAGGVGIPQSIHPCASWYAKGNRTEFSAELVEEELAYIGRPDPNHHRLQQALKQLELDFVAFDYSYDRDGELVVWEANPYPFIHFSEGRRRYRRPAMERTLAGMVFLYFERAGLPVPGAILDRLEGFLPAAPFALPSNE